MMQVFQLTRYTCDHCGKAVLVGEDHESELPDSWRIICGLPHEPHRYACSEDCKAKVLLCWGTGWTTAEEYRRPGGARWKTR